KSQSPISIRVDLNDIENYQLLGKQELAIAPNATIEEILRIQIHTDELSSSNTDITFAVKSPDDKSISVVQESRFLAPLNQVL
ncbi:MAG: FixG Ig-like domain-containing protein, partial [Pseudomonadales bacterium]